MFNSDEHQQIRYEINDFLANTLLDKFIVYSSMLEGSQVKYLPYVLRKTGDILFDINTQNGTLFQHVNFFTNTAYYVGDALKNDGEFDSAQHVYSIAYNYEQRMSYKILKGSFHEILAGAERTLGKVLQHDNVYTFLDYYSRVLMGFNNDMLEHRASFVNVIPFYNLNVDAAKTAELLSSKLFDDEKQSMKVPVELVESYSEIPVDWVNSIYS
jgi:hypothetical protein